MMNLFLKVIQRSIPAFKILLMMIIVVGAMFGTLIWAAETGQWMPPDHVFLKQLGIHGREAYVRDTGSMYEVEQPNGEVLLTTWAETPYRSAFHSFWWVVVTVTTVGYGDVFPVTVMGMLVNSVLICLGIVLISLPIGIVGANFHDEFHRMNAEEELRQDIAIKAARVDRIAARMMTSAAQDDDEPQNSVDAEELLNVLRYAAPPPASVAEMSLRACGNFCKGLNEVKSRCPRQELFKVVPSMERNVRVLAHFARQIQDPEGAHFVQREAVRALAEACRTRPVRATEEKRRSR